MALNRLIDHALPSGRDMDKWLDENNLPYSLSGVFSGDADLPSHDPENLISALFWQRRDSLIKPFRDIKERGVIEHDCHWREFAYRLSSAAILCNRDALSRSDENQKAAQKIKNKIKKKVYEIIDLTLELDELGEYWQTNLPSSQFYEYLFPKAAEIQNEEIFSNSDKDRIPGLYSGFDPASGQLIAGKYCSYSELLRWKFEDLCREAETKKNYMDEEVEVMPIFEALLLAYGRSFIEERFSLVKPYNYFEFSSTKSVANFIRFFTGELLNCVAFRSLPESIKGLSFSNIEAFAGVLYPNITIHARNCIDSEWNPIKDN